MSDDERLLEETALRRALRLDADEQPPRLDTAVLAAAARETTASPWLPVAAAIALGALVISMNLLDMIVRTTIVAAPALARMWELVSQPSVPLAILACIAVAIYYERRLNWGEQRA